MKSKAEGIVVDLLLLAVTGTAVVMSFSYNPTARMFPLYFGLIAFIFVLLNVIVASMKNPPKMLRFIRQKGTLSDMPGMQYKEEEKEDEDITWKQIFYVVLWLAGYVILLATIHYLLATLIFLILFMRIAGQLTWLKTLLIALCFSGFLYFLFEILL
jgi:hypothetical protein